MCWYLGFQVCFTSVVATSFSEHGSAFGGRGLDREFSAARYLVGGVGLGGVYDQVGGSADEGLKHEEQVFSVSHS